MGVVLWQLATCAMVATSTGVAGDLVRRKEHLAGLWVDSDRKMLITLADHSTTLGEKERQRAMRAERGREQHFATRGRVSRADPAETTATTTETSTATTTATTSAGSTASSTAFPFHD
jgi:hypothetical protein